MLKLNDKQPLFPSFELGKKNQGRYRNEFASN